MYINIYKCVINLINFVTATISFVLNVTGDLPDLQALPQPCSIKNKTDSDRIELDHNNKNNNNDNNNNNNNNNKKKNVGHKRSDCNPSSCRCIRCNISWL